jgi:N-acetylornithine carbamoyltransferase
MAKSKFFGRDFITTADWRREELDLILALAREMREKRYEKPFTELLKHRTFFMFFYNPSVRTRQSFEAAATELGGHAQFLEPKTMRLKTKKKAGETVEDAARVMSRYAVGIGIRILEDAIEKYGDGDALLREYAHYADVPILNMADDKFHPFQGLADIMALQDHFEELRGKTVLVTWAHGALARSWCSVQEHLLIASLYGMNIRLAYPEGYDLDPDVIERVKKNCEENGSQFEITHDPFRSYDGVNVVYSRNWMSPDAYGEEGFKRNEEIERALKYTEWICTEEKMKRTDEAFFIHPMPVDRGHEVEDAVASGEKSLIYEIAENRLHVQKSAMALLMSDLWNPDDLEKRNLGG